MLSRNDLHEYQERGVSFIKNKKRCALFQEMGLGKTLTTLTAIVDLLDSFAVNRVLVIAPLRVANSVWHTEAANWEHLSHLTVAIATGNQRNRIAALFKNAEITVINRENVVWLQQHYGKKWPFDMVVIDESSSFKSSSSQRWKALRRVLPMTRYMVLLTGTPSPNGLLDLWAQVHLIDLGATLGRTMTSYKTRFFESDYMGYSFTPRKGADEEIHKLIEPFCMSMAANDYLELPDRIDLRQPVDIGDKALTMYKQFEKDLLMTLPEGEEIEALSAAALANKLLQFANGATYTDDSGNYAKIHDEKLEALAELVESNDEPMLVAYNYRSDLERLQKKFPTAVALDKNPETIDRWNRGEIKMLLAHPQSAGHGLNLQHGGALCVWFGLTWSLENYMQFNGRLHRQGQARPVRIIHLVATGTIDERVLAVLADKNATQNALLSALKA